jgi:hypothetical protein
MSAVSNGQQVSEPPQRHEQQTMMVSTLQDNQETTTTVNVKTGMETEAGRDPGSLQTPFKPKPRAPENFSFLDTPAMALRQQARKAQLEKEMEQLNRNSVSTPVRHLDERFQSHVDHVVQSLEWMEKAKAIKRQSFGAAGDKLNELNEAMHFHKLVKEWASLRASFNQNRIVHGNMQMMNMKS